MVILGVVLLVVVGPKELPKLLRAVGRGINKLRTMSTDLREQSGIDDIIHDESLREDLDALRSLSRGKVVDTLIDKAMKPPKRAKSRKDREALPVAELEGEPPDAEQEYPEIGCDSYGAIAEEASYGEEQTEGEDDAKSADGDDAKSADGDDDGKSADGDDAKPTDGEVDVKSANAEVGAQAEAASSAGDANDNDKPEVREEAS